MGTSVHISPLAVSFAEWLDGARGGAPDELGSLLEGCRAYLLMVANRELDLELQAKESPSDLVQQTCLEAHQDFQRFHGQTESELIAWLVTILKNNIANARRRYHSTEMRDIGRELRLDDPHQNPELNELLTNEVRSASGIAMANEEAKAIHEVLKRLPEDYRLMIQLRHQEDLPFDEIGRRIGRSTEAVRKLWVRAIAQLQQLLPPPK